MKCAFKEKIKQFKELDKRLDQFFNNFIEKDSFKNFFKSLTWFGILYLIFKAIIININNQFDRIPLNLPAGNSNNVPAMNWNTILLINSTTIGVILFLILAVYIFLNLLIIYYQMVKVFKTKENTNFSTFLILIIIFFAGLIDIILQHFIQYDFHIHFVIEIYLLILLILLILFSFIIDFFLIKKKKYFVLFFKGILFTLYTISILTFMFSAFNILKSNNHDKLKRLNKKSIGYRKTSIKGKFIEP
jgi:hypothetical protein